MRNEREDQRDYNSYEGQNSRANPSQEKKGKGKKRRPNNSNPDRNNSKNNVRANTQSDATDRRSENRMLDNDPAWYKGVGDHIKQVEGSAKTWNYNVLGGMPLSGIITDNQCAPALCVMRMVTSPGISPGGDNISAVSMASKTMWSSIRTVLTSATNYQPADLVMAIMAMDEIYSFGAHVRRLFTLANAYYAENVNWPDTFIHGLYDFTAEDIQDLREHLGDYINRFNSLVMYTSRLTIPAEYKFIDRHRFLYSNLFGDGHTLKNQYYGFKPYGYRIWNDVGDQGSELNFKVMYTDKHEDRPRTAYLLDVFQNMIKTLNDSESFITIVGDIWKCWGMNSVYAMTPVAPLEIIVPIFDAYNVLSQIENSINVPIDYKSITTKGVYDITQDVSKGEVVFYPRWEVTPEDPVSFDAKMQSYISLSTADGSSVNDVLFNTHVAEPTVDDVIEQTRMAPVFAYTPDWSNYWVRATGYDFIDSFQVYGYDSKDRSAHATYAYNYLMKNSGGSMSEENVNKIALLSKFDWAPRLYIFDHTTTDAAPKGTALMDLDNYTSVGTNNLYRLHDDIIRAAWKIGDPVNLKK